MKWAPTALVVMLAIAVMASAVTIILTRHNTRLSFVTLKSLEQERDRLEAEWARLQLEQATWGANGRVEALAREKLHMAPPSADRVVLVR